MNILIRGTNWIGDAVMTIPAIKKLRRLFPEARLVLLTPQSTVGIFEHAGLVDEIVPVGSLLTQVKEGWLLRPDIAIIFPNSFKSALVTCLAGIKQRFGYASQNRSALLTTAVPVPTWKNSRHEVYYYLHLVDEVARTLGLATDASETFATDICLSDYSRSKGQAELDAAGADRSRTLIGLAPGSTNSRAKRWTPEGFAKLNDRIRRELSAVVVLLGSGGDKDVSARVTALSAEKPIDLTGRTDIETAAGVLGELDLLVSNDMGLAHLAPAVGTETIVIFGPTNQVTTRPFSNRATVISADVDCAPCMLRDCPIDHRCMRWISPDAVFDMVKQKLGYQ